MGSSDVMSIWELRDGEAAVAATRRRRLLTLPYTADEVLRAGLTDLRDRSDARAWTLLPSKIDQELQHYATRHYALSAKGPRPSDIRSLYAEEAALKIDSGLSFAKLGAAADPLVKPILLYYSLLHLSSIYATAFIEWKGFKYGHGLSFEPRDDLSECGVRINGNGSFARLAAACFVLTGQPSVFSPLVTYATSPTVHAGPGELLENFGKTELGEPERTLSLKQLAAFDYKGEIAAARRRHGFHKCKMLPSSAYLVDALTLFLASSLARYNVVAWQRILDGRDTPYRLLFEETFDRYLSSGIDLTLAALEKPSRSFLDRLLPSRASPYTHDDKRFGGDPDGA
jgi:hypothetical protein